MITFEDCKDLEANELKRLLKQVTQKELSAALVDASEDVTLHIFNNITDKARGRVKEGMCEEISPSDVTSAQAKIMSIFHTLQGAES